MHNLHVFIIYTYKTQYFTLLNETFTKYWMTSFSSNHHNGNSAIRNTGRHGSTYLMAVPLTPPRVACMTRVINASWRSSRSTPSREDVISTLFLDESVNLQPPEGNSNNTHIFLVLKYIILYPTAEKRWIQIYFIFYLLSTFCVVSNVLYVMCCAVCNVLCSDLCCVSCVVLCVMCCV